MPHAAAIPAYQAEHILFGTLLQLAVIILVARGLGVLFRRIGQPTVVGEIVAGLLLGPSFFGFLAPGAAKALFDPADSLPIMVISQIGLIFLMFQIGNDFDPDHFRRSRNRAAVVTISAASVLVPLGLGLLIGAVSAPDLAPAADVFTYSLFVGVALAITAVPVLGRIMSEFNLTRTEVGTLAISAAAINDVVGWTLLAGISAYIAAPAAEAAPLDASSRAIQHNALDPVAERVLQRVAESRQHRIIGELCTRRGSVRRQPTPMISAITGTMGLCWRRSCHANRDKLIRYA